MKLYAFPVVALAVSFYVGWNVGLVWTHTLGCAR